MLYKLILAKFFLYQQHQTRTFHNLTSV